MSDPLTADHAAPAVWSAPDMPEAAPLDLGRLRDARVLLEAELVSAELTLSEVRRDYARASGAATLDSVTAAERTYEDAARRLQAHDSVLAEVEAQQAAADHEAARAALVQRMSDRTREKLSLIRQRLIRQESVERAHMEATLAARAAREQERSLDSAQRNDLARLLVLDGQPSPAKDVLTPQQKANFDARLPDFFADPVQTVALDFAWQVPRDPETARTEHENRWRIALAELESAEAAHGS